MRKAIVAAASTAARWADIEGNLAQIRAAAERAADANARLLLLPECALTGGDWPTGAKTPRVDDVALALDSAPMREIAAIAKRTKVTLAVGLYEREKLRGRTHITQALVGPQGLIGAYRKVHQKEMSSRDRELFPVFDVGFARVGVMTCFDNMFPECARILALKGAELLLSPFMGLPLSRAAWRRMRLVALRARAFDNRVFLLSASHAQPHVPGRPSEWGYSGICAAIDPLGGVLAESRGPAGRPQRIAVTLDPDLLRTYELADWPNLHDRRPRDYAELTDPAVQRRYAKLVPPAPMNLTANRAVMRGRA